MTNFGILDLVIGLAFIYFILSVICTSIVEIVAQAKNLRAASLNKWIKDSFNTAQGGTLGDQIINHGLVDGLTMKGRIASFIPANVFSAALFDIIYQNYIKSQQKSDAGLTFNCERLREAILSEETIIPADLRRYMLQAIDECQDVQKNIDLLKTRIEHWYEDAMDRLTGTYRKKTRVITIIAAIALTVGINADTIAITKYLKDNPQQAELLATTAAKVAKDSTLYKQTVVKLDSIKSKLDTSSAHAAASIQETINMSIAAQQQGDSLYRSMTTVGIPMGWTQPTITEGLKHEKDVKGKILFILSLIVKSFIGWMFTAAAITLGAPFWFDILNKFVNIRSAGKKPSSTK